MSLSFDDPSIASSYRDVRALADGLATPVLQTNKRIILRSNSAVDAEWCRRILRHEGYLCEARKGRRSTTIYLQVHLGY
ncbi:hypothetical protein [Pseudorhodoferax sp. Leaf267]|jgi:hypothetical protein|uniref:hypothetical protein n=1 Tax=Pseudorhodoferax sp. Leaf267 TaxID=1736316 RepID=UPI0007145098|nr:hypothetical protein [Pseudorhodoferax sp. Leaf267]KQP14804.1 hypothetical protein ASF43_12110 [Pseudorhodoferax sp. Leaf267]